MHQEKSTITTKPATTTGSQAKSVVVDDEKAALVKSGQLPAYLQRRAMSIDEDEKEKNQHKLMKKEKNLSQHL